MWIVSQDGSRIVNVNDFKMINNSLTNDKYNVDLSKWSINDLAEYSSKEKCSKVLELIRVAIYTRKEIIKLPKEEDL